jgi:hypothetical protein
VFLRKCSQNMQSPKRFNSVWRKQIQNFLVSIISDQKKSKYQAPPFISFCSKIPIFSHNGNCRQLSLIKIWFIWWNPNIFSSQFWVNKKVFNFPLSSISKERIRNEKSSFYSNQILKVWKSKNKKKTPDKKLLHKKYIQRKTSLNISCCFGKRISSSLYDPFNFFIFLLYFLMFFDKLFYSGSFKWFLSA